jgi:hypothetical protein
MKIEITKNIVQKETIEIELPYYYKHDLEFDDQDSVIYGKIEDNRTTSIHIKYDYIDNSNIYELEIKESKAQSHSSYMTNKYKSSESEYLDAKSKLLAAVKNA